MAVVVKLRQRLGELNLDNASRQELTDCVAFRFRGVAVLGLLLAASCDRLLIDSGFPAH